MGLVSEADQFEEMHGAIVCVERPYLPANSIGSATFCEREGSIWKNWKMMPASSPRHLAKLIFAHCMDRLVATMAAVAGRLVNPQ